MTKAPNFDQQGFHKHFAADCFNNTWSFIDKPDRTSEEDEQMILLALSSLWHWTQREDCTQQNLSVGYWLAARVHALVGRPDDARRYGQRSLECAAEAEPFYAGYAYEALARAEQVAGNHTESAEYLESARQLADKVDDEDSKKMLLDDLDSIR